MRKYVTELQVQTTKQGTEFQEEELRLSNEAR
jgi:hypothetical protein